MIGCIKKEEEDHSLKRMTRAVALLLFLLMMLPCGRTFADKEKDDTSVPMGIDKAAATTEQQSQTAPVAQKNSYEEGLCRQIRDTYKAAKKRSRRRSFKGYCGAYVANQLVVLGINKTYLSANGKNTYDIYRKMTITTGGYAVTAYSSKKYSLKEALTTIMGQDPSANNILVGFQRGVSKSGKKYGHVLFIHGIRNGKIYYSDSSARTIDETTYKEGEAIVCSLASFTDLYAKYKLDGVVHFQKKGKEVQLTSMEDTADPSSEKESALGE